MSIIGIILGGVLVNNFIFMQYLGICPFIGVSQSLDTALGMSGAVVFVMTLASTVTAAFEKLILEPRGLEYLRTIAYILVIARSYSLVEIFMKKTLPGLYKALGIYLPLITTNCAVLGVAMLNVRHSYGVMTSTVNGFAGALGWSLAIVILPGFESDGNSWTFQRFLRGFPWP